MKDSNPFASTQIPTNPAVTAETNQKTRGRTFEVLHNAFRGLLAFFCIGIAPVFIAPEVEIIFQEFGLELPLATQLVLQYSRQVSGLAWLSLPLAFGLFAGIEFGIFSIRSNVWKTLVNTAYWLFMLLACVFICLALTMPFVAIMSGLTATIDLLPHLLRF